MRLIFISQEPADLPSSDNHQELLWWQNLAWVGMAAISHQLRILGSGPSRGMWSVCVCVWGHYLLQALGGSVRPN